MSRLRAPALALAAFVVLAVLPAAAHPYHVTLAEAEINAQTGQLEVSLKILPEDLRRALEAHGGGSPAEIGFDRAATALLTDTFTVTTGEGQRLPLTFVGKEISVKGVWLYFELALPRHLDGPDLDGLVLDGPDLDGLVLANRLLLDLEPTQINTVLLRQGERRTTLTLTRQSPEASLAPPPEAPPEASPR